MEFKPYSQALVTVVMLLKSSCLEKGKILIIVLLD